MLSMSIIIESIDDELTNLKLNLNVFTMYLLATAAVLVGKPSNFSSPTLYK